MANTDIYSRLKKLFSNSVIVRHVGGKELKVVDTSRVQAFMSNAIRDRYSKIHASSGYATSGTQYGVNMAYQTQRIMLFRDYDVMDNDPIITAALDLVSDESTSKNEYGDILTITSDDDKIKDILHNLFYDILNVEFNLWPWVRNFAKYGDFFLFLEISPKYGVFNVMPLSVYDTQRIEASKPENPYYVYYETLGANGYKQSFENYEIAHFRLLSDTNFLPYGRSYIEGCRRTFRQLVLAEDAMLIHRIMRAPEKRVFKVDVGNIPPAEVDVYMQRLMDKTKKVPFVNPTTGDYNLRYNMQNIIQDFYVPVRGHDDGTEITNLGGLEYNAIDDVEYILKRMLASLKIPRSYFGYEEAVGQNKGSISSQDIRFAKNIERIQRIFVSELTKIAVVHLYVQGFRDDELSNFSLALTNPSTLYEHEKLSLFKEKLDVVAQMMQNKWFDRKWIYENIFQMHEEEYSEIMARIIEDEKYSFRLAKIQEGMPDPAKFGFPQDNPTPPQQPGQPGQSGQENGQPQQVGKVDDLPTAKDLGLENEAETRGRPREGSKYGQDSHVDGRDPLGFKELYKNRTRLPQRHDKRKLPLSNEMKNVLRSMDNKMLLDNSLNILKKEIIIDNKDAGTYLDETNILEN